jgi:hypothetical protein
MISHDKNMGGQENGGLVDLSVGCGEEGETTPRAADRMAGWE